MCMCKGWKELKNMEEIIAFYVILFGFYVSLFKELSRSLVKEKGGKLTGENKKDQIDTTDRDKLFKFSGYRKLDAFSETEIN